MFSDPFGQPFPEPLARLIPNQTEAELGPGRAAEEVRSALSALDFSAAVAPRKIVDREMAEACLAGLWLGHNFLAESHAISQRVETSTGSFWHAIMHRREGDFDNACYWFHRVGRHPVYEPLRAAAAELARQHAADTEEASDFLCRQRLWDAAAFVELVRQVVQGRAAGASTLCRRIARHEWELLMNHSYRAAVGLHAL